MNAIPLSIMMCLLMTDAFSGDVLAQKIETSPASRDRILRLETALNHLTIIELSEPITMAAAGSPAFKIERRENKVFIQPLEEGQSTNLFIWTPTSRYSYELAPAGNVSTMHFALDHREPASVAQDTEENKTEADQTEAAVGALLHSIPVRWQGSRADDKRVTVAFRDVLKLSNRWLIRYGVLNRTDQSYPLRKPRIVLMAEPTSRLSLIPLSCSQLGPKEAASIRSDRKKLIDPIQADAEESLIAPGHEAHGVVGIAPPAEGARPVVLQFEFPVDQRGRVTGTLVL